jgi:DNA-binding CsgD family transcriptional regulator
VNPELTEQECQVATHAAARTSRTQRQIGAELGLSEHAVRQTLKRVYRKLGIRSRLELPDVMQAGVSAAEPIGDIGVVA